MSRRRAAQPLQADAAPLLPGLEPDSEEQGEIRGVVEKVLYADLDGGRAIVRIRRDDGTQVHVAGKGDPVAIGDEVSADGAWEVHPKWGRQFAAKFIRSSIPENAEGVVRYLLSSAIPGVGKRTTDQLLAAFGDSLPARMDAPAELVAAGIPERKAQAIVDHWRLRTRYARLLSLLYAHKLGPATAKRIIDKYGDSTMQVVLSNPYRLAEEVRGIGFKTADGIALSQNLAKDAPERIRAGVLSQMQTIARDGHCAQPQDVLRRDVAKLLGIAEHKIESEIAALVKDGKLVEDMVGSRPVLYDADMRACEEEVAELLAARCGRAPDLADQAADLDALVANAAEEAGFELHENQAAAVRLSLAYATGVVTGGPGMGKSASLVVFIRALRALCGERVRIQLAAPTGRAAKRMTEATGMEARTLHRTLEWSSNPQNRGFLRNADTPLEADAVVIDETSMLDLYMVRNLLRATPPGCRLVFVGDADQLPSVGAGNVLADMIDSGVVPVARLTKVFRTKEGSAIADAARQINAGAVPEMTDPRRSSDMWKAFVKDPAEVVDKVVKLCGEVLPKLGYDPLRDVQVLTPGHGNDSGTQNLNRVLQAALNPLRAGEAEVEHAGRSFRVRDRVIQAANDYDRDVFNGDIGNVLSVEGGAEGTSVVVDFDGQEVAYTRGELDQLQHAFATTIHRAQGSEFPVAVCVATTQHYIMLRKNLIYTAVTRARRLCCVIGQARALRIAVRQDGGRRLTGLASRLAGKSMSAPYDQAPDDVDPEIREAEELF